MRSTMKLIFTVLIASLIVAAIVLIVIYLLPPDSTASVRLLLFGPQASSSSPLISAPIVTTSLSYGDALKTYEGVATYAIHASERTLDSIKWLVGAFIGLTVLAAGTATYLYKTAKVAEEKFKAAEAASQRADSAAESMRKQMAIMSDRYISVIQKYEELKSTTLSLDAAIQRWGRGEISREQMETAQQWHSWQKWVHHKSEIGWKEMEQHSLNGLTPAMRSIVETELERVQRESILSGGQTEEKKEYERRLRQLIANSNRAKSAGGPP